MVDFKQYLYLKDSRIEVLAMSQIKWDFNGKKAIVTGGSRGIGKEIVSLLIESGAKVLFTYASNKEAAEEIINKYGSENVTAINCDFNNMASIEELISKIKASSFSKFDFLVNNAGVTKDSLLYNMSHLEWETVMQVNLNSIFYLTKQLTIPLIYSKGSIVNVTSVAGITGQAGQTNYAASKAGVIGLTKSLAKELGRFGVRVNAIAPGYVQTDMLTDLPEKLKKEVVKDIPMNRLGEPYEIANTVLFLLSNGSSYTTGQVYVVDGGLI